MVNLSNLIPRKIINLKIAKTQEALGTRLITYTLTVMESIKIEWLQKESR